MAVRHETSKERYNLASQQDRESDHTNDIGHHDYEAYGSDTSSPALNGSDYGPYLYQSQDRDPDPDVYEQRRELESSQEGSLVGYTDSSAPTCPMRAPYPAWSVDREIPLSREEIEDIFLDLAQKFGFQTDSMRNMFDLLMQLLDSRASRMTPCQALLSLHADYIGGPNANYRKWYFAAQLDFDDTTGRSALFRLRSKHSKLPPHERSIATALDRWRAAMINMSDFDRLRQIALYLLCWGEAAQVRFAPECLCYIFKCADDYYRSPECQNRAERVPEGLYLRSVIRPLYLFLRDQGYEVVDGKFVRRERDHADIIGYDDVNQLFWYPEGIASIVLHDKTHLVDVPPAQRFMKFCKIDWSRTFFKTYYEKRSIGHLLVNFNRIFVIHIAVYYFYTAYNSPNVYKVQGKDSLAMTLSATALGGAVATIIMILATLLEFCYIPTTRHNTSHLARRLLLLLVALALTSGPTFYIAVVESNGKGGTLSLILGIIQLVISVIATLLFSIIPSGRIVGDRVRGKSRKYLASQTFTASYPSLDKLERTGSIFLWVLVFGCKFAESYFFITLSFRNSIKAMVGMKVKGCTLRFFGNALCANQTVFTLALMYVMDLMLFFLDTYPWYIMWSTVFSIGRASTLGLSIWMSWREVYAKLPQRIYAKLLATADIEVKYKPIVLFSQVWNAIVIAMYREHLLTIGDVEPLLYHMEYDSAGHRSLKEPPFFSPQGYKGESFSFGGEAERRISFFAQSLGTEMPQPVPVDAMPTFTVLTPHYNEKIILSLREIIQTEDMNTRITLLEYLRELHPKEWENFLKDTKRLADDADGTPFANAGQPKVDEVPFHLTAFKNSSPEFTLRNRIWASLRTQTLYRTVSGMMNYCIAIKLLYRVENPGVVQIFGGNTEGLESELHRVATRKFKFIVSMQRYYKFNREEQENAEFLLRAYPDLQIAYFEEEPPRREGGDPRIFSALIDGHSEILETGHRRPKFRIELPGNPILGDGKADNQNHSIIFCRGEYLQLIDANQDNYLEECLKVRHVLAEFEEFDVPSQSPYDQRTQKAPVAIVGAREYVFSENIGVLGDYAAGKEQTFRTLVARLISWVGGRLHYGHPDFFNAVYMMTRGGVSKAQKGLHLNEDIYAGMNALGRGGRIKHSEYYQCGKGRDIGFGTILNFQTKIGTGMAEQMLSREYYYLGTQLPLDRFLTFYYSHPGFQMNHIQIILSVQVFVLTMVFLGTLNSSLLICKYTPSGGLLDGQTDCYDLVPVFEWVVRSIICILLVFVISFLPPFLQELVERGTWKAFLRLSKQIFSLSPVFETFSTQIYVHSILTNLTFGGARYISTGRGFATTRIHFPILFSRFAVPSIYLGMRTLVMLLYVSLTLWTPYLICFWVSVLSLCIAPFWFNPHQFSVPDFLIDYREFLRWMFRGNSRSHCNSWIGYCRLSRTLTTGYKRQKLGHPSEKLSGDFARPPLTALLFSEILFPICIAVIFVIAYMFVKSFPDPSGKYPPSPLIRIAIISLGPIVLNAAVLLALFIVSLFLGPSLDPMFPRFGSVIAFIAHVFGVVGMIAFSEFLWFLEAWHASHAVLGVICVISIQRAIYKILISVFLSREFAHDETNRAWWTGRWYGRGLRTHVFTQPAREFFVKIIELSLWSSDFLLCHLLLVMLTPPLLIPYFDRLHTTVLFWVRPSKLQSPIFSSRQKGARRWIIIKYGILYINVIGLLVALFALPVVFHERIKLNCLWCQKWDF